MSRLCRACGAENREEAAFCRSCGSPLPKKKKAAVSGVKALADRAVMRFWAITACAAVLLAATGMFVMNRIKERSKVTTINEYTSKFDRIDDAAFGAASAERFHIQSLWWNMSVDDIKRVHPYATASTDPDFISSMTVTQHDYKIKMPHANFMSLGINNGRLYAVKFEFGPHEVFESQALKVPNKDEIMYGRFKGLVMAFRRLYGPPAFVKDDTDKMSPQEAIKSVKAGTYKGSPSNIYMYWDIGDTRAEAVLFGHGKKLHLTVRFLYMPVWRLVGK